MDLDLKKINKELQGKVNPLVSREVEIDSGYGANLIQEDDEIKVQSERDLSGAITVIRKK